MLRRRNLKEAEIEQNLKNRNELFKKSLAATLSSKNASESHSTKGYNRQADFLRNKAEKTTEKLSSLVQRMSQQVKQSEETTATLIHSSAVLKEAHSHTVTIASTIRSGGKLLSKYARRETTDKILIVLALILYVGVVVYILRKRLPWFDLF